MNNGMENYHLMRADEEEESQKWRRNWFVSPITPHATLGPALPVFEDYASFPRPKSSSFLWTTTDLPVMDLSP